MMSTKGVAESVLEGRIRRQIERSAKRYEILINGAWITPRTAVLNADGKFLYCNVDGVAMKMPPHLWRRSM